MTELTGLLRFPVKSCRGEHLQWSHVVPMGLSYDRNWMVADAEGHMITGRDESRLVQIAAVAEEGGETLHLSAPGMHDLHVSRHALCIDQPAQVWRDTFTAYGGYSPANAWLSQFLEREVQLLHIGEHSTRRSQKRPHLPDLSFADGFPLLLLNTASLDDLNARIGREMVIERFRPNLVVSGAPAFAEDGWQRLRIGDVNFVLEKPCERCVFTTVDPDTGERSSDQEPLRSLARFRKRPEGVVFCMNLRAENEGEISVGMQVEVLA
ncbi:MOSC domain-containing protein [Uliginosibacterium sp. H3]|uniref:MOSC domain-containing protein n=1 Tax=Uliginosibacterium silvisoli TaxID=3114758 RepID=A0ABU6K0C0_9RHOO|nr:MOSC domain-containing protein [Uliginosibacterium sp. H3]